jgi:hypothetical protein
MKQEEVAERIVGAQTTPIRDEYLLIDFDNRNPSVALAESFHEHIRVDKDTHYFIAEVVEEGGEYPTRARRGEYHSGRGMKSYPFRHGRGITEGPRLPIAYDLALSVWADLGVHSIPVAMEDRSFILEHPQLRRYVDAHAKIWDDELGRSRYREDSE